MRLCIKCNKIKKDNNFYSVQSSKYRDVCKKCDLARDAQSRHECPEEFSLRKIKIKLFNPKGDIMDKELSVGKKIYSTKDDKSIASNAKLQKKVDDSGFEKSFGKFYEETCEKENCGNDECERCAELRQKPKG